nr:hypothetical protein [Tanacetum cinerariifolium]
MLHLSMFAEGSKRSKTDLQASIYMVA